MAQHFPCPYLNADVELRDDRIEHIQARHPGTWPNFESEIAQTLARPDLVRRSDYDPQTRLFSKWFQAIRTGRHLVIITVSETDPPHHWIITAYTARKITGGTVEWPQP